jgi:hypothetical protein
MLRISRKPNWKPHATGDGLAAGDAAGLAAGLAAGDAAGLAAGEAAGDAAGLAAGEAAGLAAGAVVGLAGAVVGAVVAAGCGADGAQARTAIMPAAHSAAKIFAKLILIRILNVCTNLQPTARD